MIKVAIVESQYAVRLAINHLLSRVPDITLIAEADSGEASIKIAKEKKPDVMVIELNLPGISGIKTAQKISSLKKNIQTIALTEHTNTNFAARFLQAGGKGFLTKQDSNTENLLHAIRTVAAGGIYLDPLMKTQLALQTLADPNSSVLNLLPANQLETLLMIMKGVQISTIAQTLCVHEKTVNQYRGALHKAFKVKTDVQLILSAMRHGIANPGIIPRNMYQISFTTSVSPIEINEYAHARL